MRFALLREKPIELFGPAGVLEGRLGNEPSAARGALLALHPHPLYGGSMDNNVVEAAIRAGQASGFITLRFNFRGVGQSQGHFDEGLGEQDDVGAALRFLGSEFDPEIKVVLGYSFGACAALAYCHTQDHGVDQLILVAPPPVLLQQDLSLELSVIQKIVLGEKDAIASPQEVKSRLSSARGKKLIKIIPGADHSFWGKEEALEKLIRELLQESKPDGERISSVCTKPRWYEFTLRVPYLWIEVLPDFLEQKGFSGVWLEEEKGPAPRLVLRAYLPEKLWRPSVARELKAELKRLSAHFPNGAERVEVKTCVIEEADWVSAWLPFFQPLKIGPVWIRPKEKRVELAPGDEEIVVDPGQAFGTGHHESTQLCLEAILQLREALGYSATILDLGTGSGILAMFAAKLGFKNILALDTDPVAVEVALENVSTNKLTGFIEARNESVTDTKKRFALILANLSAAVLKDLSVECNDHLERGGWLVAGGLLTSETDVVLRAFAAQGLELVRENRKNDWACLILKRTR